MTNHVATLRKLSAAVGREPFFTVDGNKERFAFTAGNAAEAVEILLLLNKLGGQSSVKITADGPWDRKRFTVLTE